MQDYAVALAEAVESTLPAWVRRSVLRRVPDPTPAIDEAARAAGQRAQQEVGADLRRLLSLDIDEQWTNPLALLRTAVRYPTEVLRAAGVTPGEREDFNRDRFPDDDYDLAPATWSDIDPALVGPGITWGAAKAFTHKARHSS